MCTKIPSFRKTMISKMPQLKYLDRPVFEMERLTAEAWATGGKEAEQKVRQKFLDDKRQKEKDSLQEYRDWVEEIRKKKLEELAKLTPEEKEERKRKKDR